MKGDSGLIYITSAWRNIIKHQDGLDMSKHTLEECVMHPLYLSFPGEGWDIRHLSTTILIGLQETLLNIHLSHMTKTAQVSYSSQCIIKWSLLILYHVKTTPWRLKLGLAYWLNRVNKKTHQNVIIVILRNIRYSLAPISLICFITTDQVETLTWFRESDSWLMY